MKLPRYALPILTAAALLGGAACNESPSETEDTPRPWFTQFTFGNTFINTAAIVTNQDGISADHLVDWVSQSALPNADLRLFVTHVYVPTADEIDTRVSNLSVTAGWTDGSRTPDFARATDYVQRTTHEGQLYDLFKLEGFFSGSRALTPASFANIVYTFQVEHLSYTGAVLNTSNKTIEIYKR